MDDLDRNHQELDVDALLADVRKLLSDDPAQPSAPAPEQPPKPVPEPVSKPEPKSAPVPEPEAESEPKPAPVPEPAPKTKSEGKDELWWTEKAELPRQPEPEEQKTVEPLFDDYPELFAELSAKEKPLTFYEQSKADYQIARRAEYEREKELNQRQRDRERQRRQKKETRTAPEQDESYSEWLYHQGREGQAEDGAKQPTGAGRKKKSVVGVILRVVAVLLALLLLAGCAIHFLLAEEPQSEAVYGTRRAGAANLLLVGTDQGGYRTDTILLLSLDRERKTSSLVSIPRDTLIYCEYSVPKINSAYGWAKGGEKGIRELMKRVTEIIGFEPDGYMVFDLDTFEQMVDLMGGVRFEVPMDMNYDDPSQQLSIHLPAGERRLNGAEAMQLVRFRSGYPDADLGRTGVQRAFVVSALSQWLTPKNLIHAPSCWKLLREHTKTDLTLNEFTWLAESLLLCDCKNMKTALLPGTATYIAGGSYYVLDPEGVARLVNEQLNPYEEEVSARELSIRVG